MRALASQAPAVRRTQSFLGGAQPTGSPVLASYWHLAAERQQVYFGRLAGAPPPWTEDHIVARYRFTNAYRAADRVSQDLIRVQYEGAQDPYEVGFRTLLFRLFNKTATWRLLEATFGDLSVDTFSISDYAAALDAALARHERVYSAAYILPPPQLGGIRKHENHFRLIRLMLSDRFVDRICDATSLAEVYSILRSYPSLGPFLAYQLTIDFNYSTLLDFDEDTFVVAGPGARSGIAKCFTNSAGWTDEDIIRWMVDTQEAQCADLGISLRSLFGRRLKLIDCQNMFCETDKYARVAHPDVTGVGKRARIKQEFSQGARLQRPFFPPKWDLADNVDTFFKLAPASQVSPAYAGQEPQYSGTPF